MYPKDTRCGVEAKTCPRMILSMENWTDRAKKRMKDLGLTQDDLRKTLGVKTRGAVGHYLGNRRQPTPDQMASLARALRMSMDELMTGNQGAEPISNRDATHIDTPHIRSVRIVGAAVVDETGFWKELQESADNEFYATHTEDPAAFIVRIASRRYAPAIRAGQGVLVEPGAPLKLGRMVLVTLTDGRHTIRDYHSHEHGLWVFTSMLDANDFLEIPDSDVLRVESIRYPLWLD